MDKKISEFTVASTVLGADIIPIVSGGDNKSVSVGVLSMNLPNLGNKGITKNVVTPVTQPIIPLTSTSMTLAVIGQTYTLANGSDGQEITLVSAGVNTVTPASSYVTTILMGTGGSTVTLMFVAALSKWVVKSFHNCTLT